MGGVEPAEGGGGEFAQPGVQDGGEYGEALRGWGRKRTVGSWVWCCLGQRSPGELDRGRGGWGGGVGWVVGSLTRAARIATVSGWVWLCLSRFFGDFV